jgi:hypothetical protein
LDGKSKVEKSSHRHVLTVHTTNDSINDRNTGTPDSFSGVDVGDLTGGLLNSASLLEKNNLGCFVFQVAAQAKPDILLAPLLTKLTSALGGVVSQLECPQLQKMDEAQLEKLPGYTRSTS